MGWVPDQNGGCFQTAPRAGPEWGFGGDGGEIRLLTLAGLLMRDEADFVLGGNSLETREKKQTSYLAASRLAGHADKQRDT